MPKDDYAKKSRKQLGQRTARLNCIDEEADRRAMAEAELQRHRSEVAAEIERLKRQSGPKPE